MDLEKNAITYKKALMTQFPYSRGRSFVCKNIGDYIQSVATRQFLDEIDEYIEQEEANNYYPIDKIPAKLIMNGWFQWRSENWPPSEYIIPLLISMHISPLKASDLLKEEGIAFLKKNGPVGCRDYDTLRLLESKGIPAYFSGCMTLTLGKDYKVSKEKHQKIYFVDPYFDIPAIINAKEGIRINLKNLVMGIWTFLKHAPRAIKLARSNSFFKVFSPTGFLDRSTSKLRPYYKAALFLETYRKKFSMRLLMSADYITHWIDVKMDGSITNDDLLLEAETLIRKYASASMVVTSRIHAGLPCLGLETPVVFIYNEEAMSDSGKYNTPGRLDGIMDLFRTLSLGKNGFMTKDEEFKRISIFDFNTSFNNKDEWKKYARELEMKATQFMK